MNLDFLIETIPDQYRSYRYSICTLVTNKDEYQSMVESFIRAGFTTDQCEYRFVDNSAGNNIDAYSGVNLFLKQSKGKYIIICHQDILANHDKIGDLDARIAELDQLDPNWGICGNAGGVNPNHVVYHISYPEKGDVSKGSFPLKVSSLDENFILVKNNTFMSVSPDLRGFHLYGTDLCIHAELNGFTTYAIAFRITHKSLGKKDNSFYQLRSQLIHKYNLFFRSRWIQTNSTVFYISGSKFRWLFSSKIHLFFVRLIVSIKKYCHAKRP